MRRRVSWRVDATNQIKEPADCSAGEWGNLEHLLRLGASLAACEGALGPEYYGHDALVLGGVDAGRA
jgi:hypothetical protein